MRILFIILLTFIYSIGQTQILDSNVKGHWAFESTAFVDSINDNDGTNYGATISSADPIKGNYATFDGNDRITIGAMAITNSSFTWSLWVKTPATPANNDAVVGKWYNNQMLFIGDNAGTLYWAITNEGNYWITDSPVSANTWYHLVWTYNKNATGYRQKLYVNGSIVDSINTDITITQNDKDWEFGTHGNDSYNWIGAIDEATFVDREWLASEVSTVYNSGTPTSPTLWDPSGTPTFPDIYRAIYLNSTLVYPLVNNDSSYFVENTRIYNEGYPAPGGGSGGEDPGDDFDAVAGDYYFSSVNGNDANDGLSPETPFRSLTRLETLLPALESGDSILFEGNSVYYLTSTINLSNLIGVYFGAYGEGNKPKLLGEINLTGFIDNGDDTWTKSYIDYEVSDYVKLPVGLYINNTHYDVACMDTIYPTSSTGITTLYDPDRSWTVDELIGGRIGFKPNGWDWASALITDNNENTMSLSDFTNGSLSGWSWYNIYNTPSVMDKNGEWVFQNNQLDVYYTGNLNSQTVSFPVVDTMFIVNNSNGVIFENLVFRGANGIIFRINNGTNIEFNECKLQGCQSAIHATSLLGLDVTNSEFYNTHLKGIYMDNVGDISITDNDFKYQYYNPGVSSNYGVYGTAMVTMRNNQASAEVYYNTFDSVAIAFQPHWNLYEWDFSYNLIKDYGVGLNDNAGVYVGGDFSVTFDKTISYNIFVNAISRAYDFPKQWKGSAETGAHAVYFDDEGNNVTMEYNTIINTDVALHINRSKYNTVRYNTFYNSSYLGSVNGDHAAAITMDPCIGQFTDGQNNNAFSNNTFVIGDNADEMVFSIKDDPSCAFLWGSNSSNYNKIYDGFSASDNDFYRINIWNYESLSYMCSTYSFECNTTVNDLDWDYSDVAGVIDEDEFVKVIYNTNKVTTDISIGDTRTYYGLDGLEYSGTVSLAPYTSKVLIFKNL